MPENSSSASAALAHRIRRFLVVLERVRRNPNRREAFHLIEALRCLQSADHEAGEEAVVRAEQVKPLPSEAAARHGPHDEVTTLELRQALEAIEQAQSPQ